MAPKATSTSSKRSKPSSRATPNEKGNKNTARRERTAAPLQNKKQKVAPPKFVNDAAKERFETAKKKKYLPERAIDADKIRKKYREVWRDLVESRAWSPLFATAGLTNLTIVHELYANCGDTFSGSCTVREKEVAVTVQALYDFLGLPHMTKGIYWKLQYDYNKVREVVCGKNKRSKWHPNGRSKHHELLYRYFTKEARVYLNFICNRLMPCKRCTNVRRSRVFLTYALMMYLPVDVSSLMIQEMKWTLKWLRCRLFYANTLTSYMHKLGVPNQTLDKKMPAETKVDNDTTVRNPDVSMMLHIEQKFCSASPTRGNGLYSSSWQESWVLLRHI